MDSALAPHATTCTARRVAQDTDGVRVSPVSTAHLAEVTRLHALLLPVHYDAAFVTSLTTTSFGIHAAVATVPDADGRRVVGFVTARENEGAEEWVWQWLGSSCTGRGAYIMTLGVLPAHRRHGVARQLLDWALLQLEGAGCAHVALHCLVSNSPALSLYARAGFLPVALCPRHYFIQGAWEDAVYMRRGEAGAWTRLTEWLHAACWGRGVGGGEVAGGRAKEHVAVRHTEEGRGRDGVAGWWLPRLWSTGLRTCLWSALRRDGVLEAERAAALCTEEEEEEEEEGKGPRPHLRYDV